MPGVLPSFALMRFIASPLPPEGNNCPSDDSVEPSSKAELRGNSLCFSIIIPRALAIASFVTHQLEIRISEQGGVGATT